MWSINKKKAEKKSDKNIFYREEDRKKKRQKSNNNLLIIYKTQNKHTFTYTERFENLKDKNTKKKISKKFIHWKRNFCALIWPY